ncbi:MAG: Trm112 family protein [Candidatus Aenigmatarchaeota archaeon]
MSSAGTVQELMDVLACPKCKGEVKLNKDENKIVCHDCRLKFSVEEGIPNMLLEEAERF